MITNICLLLEALSIALCIHYLYGEKFKLDIATVSYLSIYMIIMTGINYYNLPQLYTMIIYPIIFIYSGMRFGLKIRALIINTILYLAIIGGIQIIATWVCYFIFQVQSFSNIGLLIVNSMSFGIIVFLLPLCKLDKLSVYLQDKEKVFAISMIICIGIAIFGLISYKKKDGLWGMQYVILFVIIIFICSLAAQLSKYKIKSKEMETELRMHKLYAASFQNLIESIRSRQHEFDNHINAIYNQHYMYKTYEELVNAQKDYCLAVTTENRFNKLLTSGNSIIIGFLYGKFVEIDRLGIKVSYKVSVDELDVGVPVYKLVEVVGNLINNAVEALELQEVKKGLFVSMIEINDEFEIEVRNESELISYNEIDDFFSKGYSRKGEKRGLGLYNVKNICNAYKLHLFCQNKTIDGENWLCFTINNKKKSSD